MDRRLSRRAVDILLSGRYASIGGVNRRRRAQQLAAIACAYSRSELVGEHGIGETIATEIELWLQAQGLDFRSDETPVQPDPACSIPGKEQR